MNNQLKTQYTLLGFVGGDMWSGMSASERGRLRRLLSHAAELSHHVGLRRATWFNTVRSPLENKIYGAAQWVTIQVSDRNVETVGQDPTSRVNVAGLPYVPSTESPTTAVYLVDGEMHLTVGDDVPITIGGSSEYEVASSELDKYATWYVIHTHLRPVTLLNSEGIEYVVGTDYTFGETGLVFNQDPLRLFPDNTAHGSWYIEDYTSGLSYLVGATIRAGGDGVVKQVRSADSIRNLEEACANVCGFLWSTGENVVLQVAPVSGGYLYELSEGARVLIEYPHVTMSVGAVVSAGSVLGGTIRFSYASTPADDDWFNSVTIGEISESSFIPGLPFRMQLFDDYEHVFTLNADSRLVGDTCSDEFWWWLDKQNRVGETTLHEHIGLTIPETSTQTNLIRGMLSYGGWANWVIVKTHRWEDWNQEVKDSLLKFSRRQKPAGTVMLRVADDVSGADPVTVS